MSTDIIIFTGLFLRIFLTCVVFYLFFLFILKIKRTRGSGSELTPFIGLALLFLFLGISRILFVYDDYFFFEHRWKIWSDTFYKFSALSGYIGIICLVFISEKMLGKTKFSFTIFSLGCWIYGAVFLHTIQDLRWFSYIAIPISLLIVLVNFIFSLIVKTKGVIRRKMGIAFAFLLLFAFFVAMNTAIGQSILPFDPYIIVIISECGLILSIFIFGFMFLSFETFTEFGWRNKLRELFIISPNGTTLFHHLFVDVVDSPDPDLIAAGLTGVNKILAEMIQSDKSLQVVDHEDVKILFEYGNYSTLALVVYENLHVYRSKLVTLINQFENLFQDILSHWTGDTSVFLPSRRLIEENFG